MAVSFFVVSGTAHYMYNRNGEIFQREEGFTRAHFVVGCRYGQTPEGHYHIEHIYLCDSRGAWRIRLLALARPRAPRLDRDCYRLGYRATNRFFHSQSYPTLPCGYPRLCARFRLALLATLQHLELCHMPVQHVLWVS